MDGQGWKDKGRFYREEAGIRFTNPEGTVWQPLLWNVNMYAL
jgi:hypothetical protein